MNTIYTPRVIETIEQAEAAPENAVFLLDGKDVASKGRFDPGSGACRVWIAGGDGYHTTETILAEYQVTYLAPTEVFEGPGGHGRSWYIDAPTGSNSRDDL